MWRFDHRYIVNKGVFTNKINGFSAAALAWQGYIIANGGTIPDATLAIFDQYFFQPAVANGNILTELDRLNIYCGLVGFPIAARTNLVKAAHFVNPISSPTFDNNGYKTSGTSYLDLNYNPATQGVKMTQNSSLMGYVVKAPQFAATFRAMGGRSTGVLAEMYRLASASRSLVQLNDAGGGGPANTNVVTTGNVFIAARRSSVTNLESIIETNVLAAVVASTGVVNNSLYELTTNVSGDPGGTYDDKYHLASFNGSSACDYAALRTILNSLFAALGL